jgi:RecA-family ATPase
LYTNDTTKSSFEFFERHGLALLALHPGGKNPIGNDWPSRSSKDPAQWRAWRDEGFNLGVLAGESRLIIVDLDTTKEGGRDGVWGRYAAWCTNNGLPVYPPHVSTARKGMHIYFKLPDGVDAMALKANAKKIGAGIDVLVGNRQSVAPGSNFEGLPYDLFAGALAPHPAPPVLIEHCTPKRRIETAAAPRAAALPEYDYNRVARWIDRKVAGEWKDDLESPWNDQGEWIFLGKALKLHFPNEDGLDLWMRATHEGHDTAAERWNNRADFKAEYVEGMRTLKHYTGRDTTWMFGDALDVLNGKLPHQPQPSPEEMARLAEQFRASGVPVPGPLQYEEEEDSSRALPVFCAASLEGEVVPQRRWHVRDLIPAQTVTLMYGDGGTGKSLLALQLLVSTAIGRSWLGYIVEKGSCLFITAEDSRDEVHRRLSDIARENAVPLSGMADLHIVSLAGEDAIIAAPEGRSNVIATTPLFAAIKEQIAALRPKLVVLDTLADLFGGNEIDRSQARQFIGLLRGVALQYDCAVVVLAHPSLSGMDRGTSGSTGWGNSVRSRLVFARIHGDDGREADEDARVLRVGKSNYGRVGLEIPMRWRNGVFVADKVTTGGDPMAAAAKADRVFLELLAKARTQNIEVHVKTGRGYAPEEFKRDASQQCVSKTDLAAAMKRLLDAGKIENAPFGPPSRIRYRLQLAGGA